ncbi:MAG: transposase [Blastocatellia bacterium]|nr:transposase [Blastocatellia bacterium]
MPKSYAQLQQSLTFDEMMKTLDEQFRTIPDNRIGNAVQYQLPDVLKAAFAMFSLKHPSLLDFKTQSTAEENNLHNIYRIEGNIPSDNQMRGILDPVDPQLLRPLFQTYFSLLSEAGVIGEYEYRDKHVIVSLDGVEHFSSTKVHCSSCTTRKHRNGEISYHHSGLAAVLVHPERKEVFPLDFEPILNQDGAQKNDCERNAAKRLCKALNTRYPDLKIILVEDALYANAPHIRQISSYGWRFILNVKPDSHESLERQFAGRRTSGQVKELRITDPQGIKHYFAWTNDLCLCESAIDVSVDYLFYEQTDKKGKVTRWTWITNIPLNARSVEAVMRGGRARWKIENETFNTLKNQDYYFEHNYGHGIQHLATVLALLMFLAFTIDQIQQRCCRFFRTLHQGLRTKVKLWASIRHLFNVLVFKSMEALYRHMTSLYRLQIE